ncbi:MAG: diguanylate cyclase [Bacillota bacterium]
MNKKAKKDIISTGIEATCTLTSLKDKSPVYNNFAKILFKTLKNCYNLQSLRFYIVKREKKLLEENVYCNKEGAFPGHDFLPFSQVPEEIIKSHKTLLRESENAYFLMVPLVIHDSIMGRLDLKFNHRPDPEFIDKIEEMGKIIAIGIKQRIFQKRNKNIRSYFDSILKINKKIQLISELDQLISVFMETTISEFKLDRITLFLFDDKEKTIDFGRCLNQQKQITEIKKVPEIPDFKDDDLVKEEGIEGYWFFLKTSNRDIGYIFVDNIYSDYKIPEKMLEILRIIFSQFSAAIDNIILFSNIQKTAHYDELTGLHNRTYFDEKIKELDVPENYPLSIVYGDVNGLKITNDVFGHHEGDKILKAIAEVMQKVCRQQDLIVRWGGDEYIIFLPRTEAGDVDKIIKRLKNNCSKKKDLKVSLNVALGYSTKSKSEESIHEVIKQAEEKMYKQKLLESKKFRQQLVSSLYERMLNKSQESAVHTDKMLRLSQKFGQKIGLSGRKMEDLKTLAVVHDIGNVAIDDTILNKEDDLTNREWKEIRKHPEIGYRIARASFELAPLADYILSHQENWDGTGYPLQKEKDNIPFLSRIIRIIDAYEVMLEERSYSGAISKEEALKELKYYSGTKFDPELVKEFVSLIKNEENIKHDYQIINLENKVEYNLLRLFMEEEQISGRFYRFNDNIYDEIFISQKGWGYVEVEKTDKEKINIIYKKIKENLSKLSQKNSL